MRSGNAAGIFTALPLYIEEKYSWEGIPCIK